MNASVVSVSPGIADRIRSIGDMPVVNCFGVVALFSAAMLNLVSLDSAKDTIELDGQVYLKLAAVAACGLYGIIGFLADSRVRALALARPATLIVAIFALFCLASVLSDQPGNGLVSSASILCVLLTTIVAAIQLGRDTVVRVLFAAATLFVAGSWFVYFAAPEIGVLDEPIGGGEYATRMSGLAHPNTLGQVAGLCLILGLVPMFHSGRWSAAVIAIALMAFGSLFFSMSRASMFALAAAMAVAGRHLLWKKLRQFVLPIIATALISLMILSTQIDFGRAIENQMLALSKSGETEEITSATGRAEIWQKSILLIRSNPWLGYGPASSKYLLEDYSLYTHNMILNAALSGGLIAGLIAVWMVLARIGQMVTNYHPLADALIVFLAVNGLVENAIFSTLCGLPTMAWIVGLIWFQLDEKPKAAANA